MEPKEIGKLVRDHRKSLDMSQEKLADEADTGQSTIDRIERGDFKRMPSVLPKVLRVLNLPMDAIDQPPGDTGTSAIGIIPAAKLQGPRDFPVYASAEGGPGEIIRSADPVDWVPRPAPVQHIKEAYGLIVTGYSMVPEFDPGDTAIVNPRFPVLGDTTCVFYTEKQGEARATIKRLVRAASDKWHLKQWNPPPGTKSDFTLSRKEWGICHRVLGKYYRQ